MTGFSDGFVSRSPAACRPRLAESGDCLQQAVAAGAAPAFSTSLGVEDQLLLAMLVDLALPVEVFTLDTGRLYPETYQLLTATEAHFGRRIRVYMPERGALEAYVALNGINGFYDSVAQRQACCQVRKTDVLRRALAGKSAWITGLRRGQANSREHLEALAFDAHWGLLKVNPLLNWSEEEVWAMVNAHAIPVNPLHQRGFPSIGCAPCTRSIAPGEDVRAGRWWWEAGQKKECGIHVNNNIVI